jgi:hypothetical protein
VILYFNQAFLSRCFLLFPFNSAGQSAINDLVIMPHRYQFFRVESSRGGFSNQTFFQIIIEFRAAGQKP